MDTVFEIRDLRLKAGDKEIVRGISFALSAGESIGLVGESGSGKTMTLRAVIGLLPKGVEETHTERTENSHTAMVFQNPLTALDPLCRVGKQLTEVIRIHGIPEKRAAEQEALHLFERLSLTPELFGRYPWELSGGQCQRIVIAMALACRPEILLCDEPTTALDVTVQRQTLDLIRDLQKEYGFAMIFVTHNLAVASEVCSRLLVMRQGEIIEEGSTEQILHEPQQEYTKLLIDAILPVPEREPGEEGSSADSLPAQEAGGTAERNGHE